MEIVSPDSAVEREVMRKEQTFRSEDNDFWFKTFDRRVVRLRSKRLERIDDLNDLNGSEATTALPD
jgi:hypothetical protein